MVRVLFVCLGNICRSPTAEGVFRRLLQQHKLQHRVEIESAGTSGWHVGEPPDRRAQAEARRRGIDISGLRGRAVHRSDFTKFDYIIAMDDANLAELRKVCPPGEEHRIYRFTDFAPELNARAVPDPYYGGDEGFSQVYLIIEESAAGLLKALQEDNFQGGQLLPETAAEG